MNITTTLMKLKEYFTKWYKEEFYELYKDFKDNAVNLENHLKEIASIISKRLDETVRNIAIESDIQELIDRDNTGDLPSNFNLKELHNRIKQFECNNLSGSINNVKTPGIYSFQNNKHNNILLVFKNNDIVFQIKCINNLSDDTIITDTIDLGAYISIRSWKANNSWTNWTSVTIPEWVRVYNKHNSDDQYINIYANKKNYKWYYSKYVGKLLI